jgi:phosphate transport system substrate-binding protein
VRRLSILVIALTLSLTGSAMAQDGLRLTGSGATFPFPIYSAWFKAFSGKSKGTTVDYQGKGSGAGIQDFLNHTVDFAASDAAMTDEDMAKVPGGVQLLPMTAGEIVVAYNLPGNPKGLKLPRDVYAGIFLGKITKWSDAKLKAATRGPCPTRTSRSCAERIRAAPFVFTSHLSAISEEWKKTYGAGTTVNWPEGRQVRGTPQERRGHRHHQADARGHRLHRYAFAKFAKVEMAELPEQGRPVRRRAGTEDRRPSPACSSATCARGSRIPGRQGVPDRDLPGCSCTRTTRTRRRPRRSDSSSSTA